MKTLNKRNKQKGSFILELMIGLFMSLITILGVMTIYSQFEGQKRTTTQAGQTIGNVALSLFPIQQFGRMSGFGFNSKTHLGVTVNADN